VRPQEVVNRAIVDSCDLLLGIFWTRIGSSTGLAESGTLEEISRVAKAGKPIMLYFSRVGMDPESVDLEQLGLLKKFKTQTYPNALTESYKSLIEFRDKLSKQLELKVRDLQKADNIGQIPPLTFTLGPYDSAPATAEATVHLDVPSVTDLESALSVERESTQKRIREEIIRLTRTAATIPLWAAIENRGSSGIRNLYVEVTITPKSKDVEISDHRRGGQLYEHLLGSYDWHVVNASYDVLNNNHDNDIADSFTESSASWQFRFEWDALQPQRTRVVRKPQLWISPTADTVLNLSAKVFADSFPEPVLLTATLIIKIRIKPLTLGELIPDLEPVRKEPGAVLFGNFANR